LASGDPWRIFKSKIAMGTADMKRTRKARRPGERSTARAPVPPGGAEFYSTNETARLLRVGINQVYGAINRNEIRALRIGGQFRVPRGEIDRLKRGQAAAP
jgi:excisionase family DNA binding protein